MHRVSFDAAMAEGSSLYINSVTLPASLAIAVAVLALAAALAGFIPARRAASIEPMDALRTE
ncbi:MAG: hypothetical protein WB555_04140 [Candidatus Korobacteraceae bacterium]